MTPRAPCSFGFAEFFALGEYQRADRIISALQEIGCSSLRVSVPEGDYYAPGGEEWYGWLFRRVASKLELVPFLHSASFDGAPPSSASGALRGAHDYADFVDAVLTHHGKCFTHVEVCIPPPTNRQKRMSPESWLPSAEILTTTLQATRGWNVVFGIPVLASSAGSSAGLEPGIDPFWVHALGQRGLLDEVSAVSIQRLSLSGDSTHWVRYSATLRDVLGQYGSRVSLWLTDGGHSSEATDENSQLDHFRRFLDVPAERHYWRQWEDRPTARDEAAGLGAFHQDGTPKLLGRFIQSR